MSNSDWWSSAIRPSTKPFTVADLRKAIAEADRVADRPSTYICGVEEYEFYKRLGRFDVVAWIKHKTGATDEEMTKVLDELLFG
jgi:hypothetical protein